MARPSEDDLIARYFRPLATDPGAFRLGDDCATLAPAEGHEFVLKTDAIAEGVHFFSEDSWRHVARKALRVNLSDLAAKGAEARGYLLSLALPEAWTEAQLADFSEGLALDQAEFGVTLLGGDTIRSPKGLVITITVIGSVPRGTMARRGGARPGDILFVTGTIGDAALGLGLRLKPEAAEAASLDAAARAHLLDRYLLPRPRLGLAPAVQRFADGAMDISDGLVLDATRMARVSTVDAEIDIDAVPLSPAAATMVRADARALETVLTGGDDYELLLAVPQSRVGAFRHAALSSEIELTAIGRITDGSGNLRLLDQKGRPVALAGAGFRHF